MRIKFQKLRVREIPEKENIYKVSVQQLGFQKRPQVQLEMGTIQYLNLISYCGLLLAEWSTQKGDKIWTSLCP